jgi:hypothetical protein
VQVYPWKHASVALEGSPALVQVAQLSSYRCSRTSSYVLTFSASSEPAHGFL